MATQREKRAARRIAGKALRDGTLVRQPCEVCGEPASHGHHEDYAKPLEVRWLCARHHGQRHAELPHRPWTPPSPPRADGRRRQFTLSETRQRLATAIKRLGGYGPAADAWDISVTYLYDATIGRREPGRIILAKLGLVRADRYVKISEKL